MSGLSVLSIGFTRSLWDRGGKEDTQLRMRGYSESISKYFVIVNSYKRHKLAPRELAGNFAAIPTNAFCALDSFIRMLLIGRRILRKEKVSLIQAQDPILTGAAAVILGAIYKVRVNVCVYGPNVFDRHWLASARLNRLAAPLGRWVLRRAHAVQVDGKMTAARLSDALGGRIPVRVKPMVPRNLDRFFAIGRQDAAGTEPFLFLFAGRLERQKNLGMLAGAFARIRDAAREEGLRVSLAIAGEGSLADGFRAALEKTGSLGDVRFLGRLANDDMIGIFASADALALSSFYEGFPRVLMEGAAAGIPAVTTAVSGSDECVRDGETGFIVPIGDEEAFARKAMELVRDRARAREMGRSAREHARACLNPVRDLGRQVEIWESLAQGPAREVRV